MIKGFGIPSYPDIPRQPSSERFRLVTDGDGHWYLIPNDRENDWDEWRDSDDHATGIPPDWAVGIDGPGSVTFVDPRDG